MTFGLLIIIKFFAYKKTQHMLIFCILPPCLIISYDRTLVLVSFRLIKVFSDFLFFFFNNTTIKPITVSGQTLSGNPVVQSPCQPMTFVLNSQIEAQSRTGIHHENNGSLLSELTWSGRGKTTVFVSLSCLPGYFNGLQLLEVLLNTEDKQHVWTHGSDERGIQLMDRQPFRSSPHINHFAVQ